MASVSSPVPRLQRSLSLLLRGAIDYAGLFPPAALSMPAAVREYQLQRSGPNAWALGRFVLGVDGLDALVASRSESDGEPWPVSVLASGAGDAAQMARTAGSQAHWLTIASIEAKGSSSDAIAALAPLTGIAPELYVELAATDALSERLDAVRSLGARAKIRTGGVTRDAFPGAQHVAHFMTSCVSAGVPFKATAGLHHLVRGEYPLTYEEGSQRGTMFGFLNVFVAAALAQRNAGAQVLVQVLEERAAHAFELGDDALRWREWHLTSDDLATTRASVLASFGSCSFREPIAELHAAFATA